MTAFLYRWAAVAARADSPSIAELVADGWTVEHVDPRYGTALMRKEEPDAPMWKVLDRLDGEEEAA